MSDYLKVCFLVGLFFFSACGKSVRSPIGYQQLKHELSRLGIEEFSKQVSPQFVGLNAHLVDFRNIEKLDPHIKNLMAECYIIGEQNNPEGISFCIDGGTYYFSLNGKGVPSYFSDYKRIEVSENIFRIYR